MQQTTKCLVDTAPSSDNHAKIQIKDKVAVLTDTQYSPRLIPLILHFHAVLGPDWPIIFFTSQDLLTQHLQPESINGSAIWRRVVQSGQVQLRTIPDTFDMQSRWGVNVYLSRPWLWEQLAPAQHALVFQTDAILCGNAHRAVDDFLAYDFIGAPLRGADTLVYNGGLSLRNRSMISDLLREGSTWEDEVAAGTWNKDAGEDVWFSEKIRARGGNLPEEDVAMQFACGYEWNLDLEKESLGYHKMHKYAPARIGEISDWCPEIALAAPGNLR